MRRAGHALAALAIALAIPVVAGAQAETTDTTGEAPVASAELEMARRILENAQRNFRDPARAKEHATTALGLLTPMANAEETSCEVLLLASEAALRAAEPTRARKWLIRAREQDCPPAFVEHYMGWMLEFNSKGERRGEGADLHAAETAYARAALIFLHSENAPEGIAASALATAAELALLRGEHAACQRHARRGLRLEPADRQALGLALSLLECGGRLWGEGNALQVLSEELTPHLVTEAIDLRLPELKKRLDDERDAVSLAAVAQYSLLVGTQAELHAARRYLWEAIATEDSVPDLWYLNGAVRERQGHPREAIESYRRQLKEQPGTRASRLAANDLAHLIATLPGTPEELKEALGLIDRELEATPEEAAMHDTRARVLLAMGREKDALTAFDRALELSPDPRLQHEVDQLRQGLAP